MYLSPSLNKPSALRRQRNVSSLFISSFDKYRQLSLKSAAGTRKASLGLGETGRDGKGDGRTQSERENWSKMEKGGEKGREIKGKHGCSLRHSVDSRLLDRGRGQKTEMSKDKRRIVARKRKTRSSHEEWERNRVFLFLSTSSNIPARPQFSVRARSSTPRRRLNAINDLISVITVLIYREQRGRGWSPKLRLTKQRRKGTTVRKRTELPFHRLQDYRRSSRADR